MPYVRTVKTASGATAVQIVCSSHRGSRDIEHIGSAHDDAELKVLKAVARQRLAAGQGWLDLGPGFGGRAGGGLLPIMSSRIGHLQDALGRAYDVLGLRVGHGRGRGRDRRALRGIDEQVAKAEKAIAGQTRSSATGSRPAIRTAVARSAQAAVPSCRLVIAR